MFVLALNLALLLAIVGGGIALERRLGLQGLRYGLPTAVRAAIDLVAFGVFGGLLFFVGVSVPVVDDTVAAMAVFVVLWIGLPLLASQFFDPDASDRSVTHRGCDR